MIGQWRMEDYSQEYDNGIVSLFNDVFKKNIDSHYLEWKNRMNPSGNSIIKLALDDEKVIGHVCLMGYDIKVFDEDTVAGQAVDTMVNPEYRRMGIFEELSKASFKSGEANNTKFIFRFPNHMALSASLSKLNTKKICDIPQYIKILKPYEATSMFTSNNLVRLAGTIGFGSLKLLGKRLLSKAKDYEIKEIESFSEDFDTFWEKIKSNYGIAVIRSSRYLNWRYIEGKGEYHRKAVYKGNSLIGYIVLATENKKAKNGEWVKICHIAEIFCMKEDAKALKMLLMQADSYAESKNACAISCWMLRHWFYGDALKSMGYLQLRAPSVLAGVVLSDDRELQEKVLDSSNWFVTIGDSDYV